MARRLYRRDFGTLGKVQRTQSGGLMVEADLTRTGVFTYVGDDGSIIREWRPPEEVFRKETVDSLRGATLTNDHPPESIKPENFRVYSMGHLGDDVRRDGDKTVATTYWQDAEAIRAIEAGRREISCGYHCDVDETSGITPDGETYDRIQRGILYNHAALVDSGRAGPEVRLRLDSTGNQVHSGAKMDKTEIINGIEYQVGTDAHRDARSRQDATNRKLKASYEEMQGALRAAEARADSAEKKLNQVVTAVRNRLNPGHLDAAVRNRTEVVAKANAVLGKAFKCDGISNREIKLAVVKKAYPDVRLDGKSKDFINGLYKAVRLADGKGRNDSAPKGRTGRVPADLRKPPSGRTDSARTLHEARQDAMDERSRAAQPLALSRRDRFKQMSSNPMLQSSMLETEK